ncbi:MAG: BlaI/MecI/CopY family transcriptional regulator [Gemmatimonadaceae bacterium]
MKDLGRISEHQLDILNVLWEYGEATAREVHEALEPVTGHARKTTGTLLHRLEKQRLITHREDGREFVYRACVTREEVQEATVRGVLGQLFQGELPALVNYALSSSEVEPGDLARIRALIDEHQRGGSD